MEARQKSKRRKPWWLWVLFGLLVIIAAVFIWLFTVYNAVGNLQKSGEDSKFSQFENDTTTAEPPKWEGTERVNILLMGGDGRGLEKNQVARSDSMIVLSIDPATKKGHVFSVLRDTYVEIPGHGSGRINTAVTLGGERLARTTIGNLLGLDIQYYVYTEFEGFKSLVDAIGGIDFYVEKDMNYVDNADKNRYDIHLKKGQQHLDGDKALQYVRFRHDQMSDFTRTGRQREFLSAVAHKVLSGWNILRMTNIINSVSDDIETNLSVEDMLKLGQLGLGVNMAGSEQVPPMDLISSDKVGGAAVIGISDEDKLREFVQDSLLKDSTPATGTGTDGTSTDGTNSTDSGTSSSSN
ncbi:LCP family protein [Paenibacillus sp. MMS18-CY102]|uniref:LCP family protein n=1 Tax=Paenibacillus sp. MMS18-CY102 TaxID=2682849 RepID=UPI001366195E|nr:LCP family protein [Paenibacillus sp. MMS18-CY102]MWC29932.1 LytR family transcriptional regulator [Paenibacillus sp. MMS18-CY102]